MRTDYDAIESSTPPFADEEDLVDSADEVDSLLPAAQPRSLVTSHVRKQLDAISSIERRQSLSIWRILSCRCLLSTFMLVLFVGLAYTITQALLDPTNKNNRTYTYQSSQYDYIVVGGGPAGSVVARRLVDAGAAVLLLEAGVATQFDLGGTDYLAGPLTRFDVPLLWSSVSHYPAFHWPGTLLAKGLGGCGIHNAMIYIRALRTDIEAWNLSGWTWPGLLAAYKSLESFEPEEGDAVPTHHGSGGPIATSRPTFVDEISPEFVSAALQAGIPLRQDFNAPDEPREGVGYYHFNIRGGVRDSAARAMLKSLLAPAGTGKASHKLELQLNATATRILLAPVSSPHPSRAVPHMRALGVEYTRDGATHTAYLRSNSVPPSLSAFPSGCVILTAGTIMTPKLLLVSGIGPSSDLDKAGIPAKVELNSVGSNVQDHPAVGVSIALAPEIVASFPSIYDFPAALSHYTAAVEQARAAAALLASAAATAPGKASNATLLRASASASGSALDVGQESGGALSGAAAASPMAASEGRFGVMGSVGLCAGAFLRSPLSASPSPDLQLTVFPAVTEPHLTLRAWSVNATPREILLASKQMLVTVALLRSDMRSKVVLNATHPLTAVPRLVTTRGLSVRDVEALVWGVREVRRIVSFPPVAQLAAAEISPSLEYQSRDELFNWVKGNVFPNSHWVGSARMGSDPDSVVDERLNVRGVAGLKIADASIMPLIPNGNVHSTVTAIASMAVDIILADNK